MKHFLLFLSTLIFINSSAQNSSSDTSVFYGGIFKYSEGDYFKNLFPHNIRDMISFRIAAHVYEGLFKYDPATLKPVKCLVEDYTLDSSRTIYTFRLKQNIIFHNDPCFPNGKGRELTASDVAYCFMLLCRENINNQGFSSTFKGVLKGADNYYKASAGGINPDFKIEGIKVLDKYTLQLTLIKPSALFLYTLSTPFCFIFPKEAYKKYYLDLREHAVGTGPFMLSEIDAGYSVKMIRNPRYHQLDEKGNRLPYLKGIQVEWIKEKEGKIQEFKKGNLHLMLWTPQSAFKTGELDSSLYNSYTHTDLATHFICFNTQNGVLQDKNIRKALSFAIDRTKILQVFQSDLAVPGQHGITPPAFADYSINNIKGYDFYKDSAIYYLKKASYPKGKNFPKISLQVNPDGQRNVAVAEEIQRQLKEVLNISIELEIIPLAQLLENAISGKNFLFRGGWLADTPHPENFLWFFYGKNVPADKNAISYPNMSRYVSSEFDSLFEKGLEAETEEQSLRYFQEAENVMMQDAPVLILWYDVSRTLTHRSVKNFISNPMNYLELTRVQFTK